MPESMGISVTIDPAIMQRIEGLFHHAPFALRNYLAAAMKIVGQSDLKKLRAEQLSGGPGHIKLTKKGAGSAFRSRVLGNAKGQPISALVMRESSYWDAAPIFETGGVIYAHDKWMPVPFPNAGPYAKHANMVNGLRSGLLGIVPTPRGLLIVATPATGGKESHHERAQAFATGQAVIVGILVKSVTQKKRLDFYGNFTRNAAAHERIWQAAGDKTLAKIAEEVNSTKPVTELDAVTP